jgi:glyoxylase-like metal-dependent hydrolase (beta-lactamase superfamily II)
MHDRSDLKYKSTIEECSIRKILLICSIFLISLLSASFGRQKNVIRINNDNHTIYKQHYNKTGFAFVTYASDYEQERKVKILIKSIRELGGKYSECPIYVVLGDTANYPCSSIKTKGVILLPVNIEPAAIDYPLAIKAYAAAQVEKIVSKDINTLAWFDPETIVLGEIDDLDLTNSSSCAIRPVFLVNSIGQKPDEPINNYWLPILSNAGLNPNDLFEVETILDDKKIRSYFNCEIFSVDPRLGILQQWAKDLTSLIKNSEYQQNVCKGFLQKLFLHQAVLSAVMVKNVPREKMHWLPLSCGYPLHLQERISNEKKTGLMNNLSCAILEDLWNKNYNWMKLIEVKEPLKTWMINSYLDFMKVTNNIYRIEGSCNSYLVTTQKGSVIIDPSGASQAPQWFEKIIEKYPLRAILLTHGHNDHRDSIGMWKRNSNIPVIAQREIIEFINYQNRLSGFFARRNAIWQRKPIPDNLSQIKPCPIEPILCFDETYNYKLGGLQFEMIHTGGETPDHSLIHIPELKVIIIGDNYYSSFPNLYTLRGTKPRWALDYIKALDTAVKLNPEILLDGHDSPLAGNNIIKNKLTHYSDAIKYIHYETVKGINAGRSVYDLMQEIKLPAEYDDIGQFYGRVSWSVRGIYDSYIGFFDEDPLSMYEKPISDVYPDLIHLSGGSEAVMKCAKEYLAQGDYFRALGLSGIILNSEPNNKIALEIKLNALKSLRLKSRNYIENIWLDFGTKCTEEKLKQNETN